MTDYKLWPATNGPDTAASDSAVTAGVEWRTTRNDLYLKGYRYYRGTTAVRGTDVATWNHDTTSMITGSQTAFTTPTATGWQEALLTTPYPAVASGVKYVSGVLFTDPGDTANCHYTATTGYWSSGAGTSGIGDTNLSAPGINDSAGGQGKFVAGSTLARPVTNANGINFWVEPILSDSDGSGGGGDPEETGTVSAQLVGTALPDAFAGLIDWENGTIVATLHTAAWTPDITTLSRVSGLANEVVTGHGYVQGTGQVLTGKSSTFVSAASLTARANSTAYAVGDLVRPASSNGHVYRCIAAGTSASSAPTWPTTPLTTVTDGTVTWIECGRGVAILDCDPIEFGGITGEALYLVLSDRTASGAANQPVILLVQFEQAESGTTQFDYHPPAGGLVHFPVF
ncbi:hypothetical protein Ssi03_50700 [Sphaerisporangium siamense]|uniref:DUF4082 domain-containing protein n=1 Tax=Sphaerisporangium siamense TaxID=795645 RepID=A0A7W7D8X4_9ACTN|nr:DUF4082 domain-containing protein [Sphaerisporangium siamense]MBB4702226.1 hypothetical protein [Sphaerisporangium siamense]GII87080.1 hypothetical protein Ssi03_50700 [Sphaerisporangium siamense]